MRCLKAVFVCTVVTLCQWSYAASGLLWDNGEWDVSGNLRSDRNTSIPESWTVDDVILTEPVRIQEYEWWSISPIGMEIVATDFIVLTEDFDVVCELRDLPFTREFVFIFHKAFEVFRYVVPDLDVRLPPGRYYVGARPVGTGSGGGFTTLNLTILGETQGYFRSAALGYPDWVTIRTVHGTDFDIAFRVYGNVTCEADVDGNGTVGFEDILAILAAWGECPNQAGCPEDLDGSGHVDFADILVVLGAWGPCP